MIAQRRDENEMAILELARKLGAYVIPQDRKAGFDVLIIDRGQVYIVEIKNPATHWSLTENEEKTCQEIEKAGEAYYIIETQGDLIKMMRG